MMIVWWTIPGSQVAMEWHPEEGVTFDSTAVEQGPGIVSMALGKPWGPQWSGPREATGQPLKDLSATFASEANILPTAYVITWIDDVTGRAVSWDRRDNRWRMLTAERRGEVLRVAREGTTLRDIETSTINEAGDVALDLLSNARSTIT